LADLTAAAIGNAARAVKTASKGRGLFGVPFGDFLSPLLHQNGLQHSGQLGLHRVLDNPDIDFLIAPAARASSRHGGEAAASTAPEASIQRHGKLLFHGTAGENLNAAAGYAARKGMGLWWEAGPVDKARSAAEYMGADTSPGGGNDPEIALLIDDESMLYVQRPADQLVRFVQDQVLELSRADLCFDTVLLRDVDRDVPYRFLVFPNLFYADLTLRRSLHALFRRWGATVLWTGAPGFVRDEARFENMESLVGIHLKKPPGPHRALIRARCGQDEVEYGMASMQAHTPVIDDGDCTILGEYVDSKLPGLGIRPQKGWRSIYSGVPAVSAELLRHFAREAGIATGRAP
jgi:hypothetical protein